MAEIRQEYIRRSISSLSQNCSRLRLGNFINDRISARGTIHIIYLNQSHIMQQQSMIKRT